MSTLINYSASQPNLAARAADEDEPLYWGLRTSAWVKVGVIATLFVLLFWLNLRRLWDKTNPITGEANWGHAMFVPLVGLYYLYVNREKLLNARVRVAWEGLIITVAGIGMFAWAIWPLQNDWVKDFGMVVTLFGVVTFLCGWQVMKTAWFPIVFLICALPWPGLFYSLLASPLQKLAALVAVHVLRTVGVEAAPFGTKIFIVGGGGVVRTLNVAEACAGLRSLMTFVSIAAAVAFLSARPLWQKIVLVFSAIPIAIFCNTMRVAGQGILDHYVSQQWSESFAHGFIGLVMMIPAFFLILLVGWVLQNIFVDEVDDKAALRAKGGAGRESDAQVIRKQKPLAPTARVEAATRPAALAAPALALAPAEKVVAPARPAAIPAARPAPAAPPSPVRPAAGTPPVRRVVQPPPPAGAPIARPPVVRRPPTDPGSAPSPADRQPPAAPPKEQTS